MNTNFSNALKTVLTLVLAAFTLSVATYSACGGDQVPFKGTVKGAIVGVTPDPGGLILTVQAIGRATHLGQLSRTEVLLFNPVTGALNGSIVFTAANGDKLSGTVAGGFTSATTAEGTYSFTGGTGRFSGSSGGATFAITSPDGLHFAAKFEGTLSSVGAK